MEQEKIDRINYLARESKARELTKEEIVERAELRAEYISSIRRNLRHSLDNMSIEEPDGSIHKLKEDYNAKKTN